MHIIYCSLFPAGWTYLHHCGKSRIHNKFIHSIGAHFRNIFKAKTYSTTWIGAVTAAVGLYFLSINEDFSIQLGDLLQLIGAFFWAAHIQVIDRFVKNVDAVKLSSAQFATCSILSLITAFALEDISIGGIYLALIPILFGGIMSVGVAYTLQAVGQRYAKPAHAAIALSMEAVFAAIGGMLILKETMNLRGYFGCALMLAGMLITQTENIKTENK